MRDSEELEAPSELSDTASDAGPDWQAIVDAIDTSIRVYDADGRLVAWNKAFSKAAGDPPLHLCVGMTQFDVLEQLARRGYYGDGDPKDLAAKRLGTIINNRGRGAPEEIAVLPRMIRTRKRFWQEDGTQIATSRNIDQQTVIEQELANKSAILQTVFETLSQPICVWDGDRRLVACNDKFAELIGQDPSGVAVGMHAREFILSSARRGFLGEGDPVALAEARYHELWDQSPPVHEVVHRAGGRTFDVHRGHLPDGGVVSVFNDVTERARAAEELREAKMQAENANAVKSDFLANMSHELRTPLNAIMGFAEMMMHTRFDDPARYQEYAGDIRGSAELLLNIINDLLDLSRIEAGKTEFRLVTVNLHDCAATCVDLIRRTDGAQRLTIENLVPSDFPHAQLDETFLRQALLNLLSNAVKATPDGGRITVTAERSGYERFALTIADTGIGMPPDMVETVFNPYDGSGNSYVRKEKGTGLGLSIVKRLVEMLRGDVSIVSAPGEGTTVRMDLPISFTTRGGFPD
ncbi:MAG: PAS-domain containing protein [Rhodospirillales bacterium]